MFLSVDESTTDVILISIFLLILFYSYANKFLNPKINNSVAFFHPYCAAGGGGERVLWVLVSGLLIEKKRLHIYIYTGDRHKNSQEIIENVSSTFMIDFTEEQRERLHFVFITSRTLLEAKWYPVFTMLFQSLASMIVGVECLLRLRCPVLVDTMGCPFIYPVFKLLGVFGTQVVAYVHYPIISTDMLTKVAERRPTHHGDSTETNTSHGTDATADDNINSTGRSESFFSRLKARLKLVYYRVFAYLYGFIGYFADVAVVNSSWTEGHIKQLWWLNKTIVKIYPPCNTTKLISSISIEEKRERKVLSLGQFRPEKDHFLQINAFRRLQAEGGAAYADVQLVIMGSTRNAADELFLRRLFVHAQRHCYGDTCRVFREVIDDEARRLCRTIGGVQFIVDAPYSEVRRHLATASVGLHTMWNEHFGISIVEMMAAGLIVVAHNSGGPKMDIVRDLVPPGAGYLAETEEEYTAALKLALGENQGENETAHLRQVARTSAERFSDDVFVTQMLRALLPLLRE